MPTQCYLPPGRADIPAHTPAEAGTRLSDPGGMQGWVDLVGLLHTEMVTHPSTNRARRALTSFMRRTPLTTTPRHAATSGRRSKTATTLPRSRVLDYVAAQATGHFAVPADDVTMETYYNGHQSVLIRRRQPAISSDIQGGPQPHDYNSVKSELI